MFVEIPAKTVLKELNSGETLRIPHGWPRLFKLNWLFSGIANCTLKFQMCCCCWSILHSANLRPRAVSLRCPRKCKTKNCTRRLQTLTNPTVKTNKQTKNTTDNKNNAENKKKKKKNYSLKRPQMLHTMKRFKLESSSPCLVFLPMPRTVIVPTCSSSDTVRVKIWKFVESRRGRAAVRRTMRSKSRELITARGRSRG